MGRWSGRASRCPPSTINSVPAGVHSPRRLVVCRAGSSLGGRRVHARVVVVDHVRTRPLSARATPHFDVSCPDVLLWLRCSSGFRWVVGEVQRVLVGVVDRDDKAHASGAAAREGGAGVFD
ncbi:Uncharacterised protein [Mycobacteroides abscessus subsp. abscessus]|nr:Uncharacterised protein [Mycobacteroides abscessus subsp. abscessus]